MDESNVDRTSSEDVIRKDFSVVWTVTASFSTCVLSKATLEGTKLILHCKITWTFRTIGLFIFITLVLLMICNSRTQSGLIAGGKDKKEDIRTVSSIAVDPMMSLTKEELYDVTKPRQVLADGKSARTQFFGSV